MVTEYHVVPVHREMCASTLSFLVHRVPLNPVSHDYVTGWYRSREPVVEEDTESIAAPPPPPSLFSLALFEAVSRPEPPEGDR